MMPQALTSVKVAQDGDDATKKKKKKKKVKQALTNVDEDGVPQGPSFDELFKATGGRRLGE